MAARFNLPTDVLGKQWEEEAAARRIWFPGQINEDSILALCIWLKKLGIESAEEPIELLLSSQGGSLWACDVGVGAIDTCPAPVHCTAMGHVASGAIYLMAVCDLRRASRYTRFLIHAGTWDENGNTVEQKQIAASEMQADNTQASQLLAQYSSKPAKFWDKMLVGSLDHYFSPATALEWGLIDEII